MKKVLAIVLSLVMVLSLATAALAVNPITATSDQTGTATAWYKMDVAYTVTFPDDIEIADYQEASPETYDFRIEGAKLEYGKELHVAITSLNNWNLKNVNAADVLEAYTLTMASDSSTNGNIDLAYEAGEESNQTVTTLSAKLTTEVEYADRFEDTLTFTVT